MIKAVLFDLDGTLINTNELIIASFKHTYKKHLNLEVITEDICKYFGEPLIKTLARYDTTNTELLMTTFKEFNSQMHDGMAKSFDGVVEAIASLKTSGIKVGVVTSKRKEMTIRGLKLIGIDNTMDVIITPEDTDKHKPEPEPILKACSILNISPGEALYVGDTSFDIMCSKGAGTKICLVKYTMLPIEELLKLKPEYLIDKLSDIVDIVKIQNSENVIV